MKMPAVDRYTVTTDFYVHYAAYIVWFEEARSHYARSRGTDYADFERAGYLLSGASVQARYGYLARYGERVAISCCSNEALSARGDYSLLPPKSGAILQLPPKAQYL